MDTITLGSLYLDGQSLQIESAQLCSSSKFTLGYSVPGRTIRWVPVNGALFCTQNLLTNVSWDTLNELRLIRGAICVIDGFVFRCRVPHGGISSSDQCEWADAMDGGKKLFRWADAYSWCQEDSASYPGCKVCRGYGYPYEFYQACSSMKDQQIGWRPVLEPIGFDVRAASVPGCELIVWEPDRCTKGVLREITEYDLILDRAENQSPSLDTTVIIERANIQCVQIGDMTPPCKRVK